MKNNTISNKKMHPYKFAILLSIASISMLFAALTSAYIVKRGQIGWKPIDIPFVFYISTFILITSSIVLIYAKRAFKTKFYANYRKLVSITFLLGLSFLILQALGFYQMIHSGIVLSNSNVGAFIYIIAGLHALHIVGGVIALLVLVILNARKNSRIYSSVGIDVVSIYWHFIDFLWIYLFVFFILFK